MTLILDYSIRIAVSLLCGLLLGLERKFRHHTVGIKTLILISVSSTLLSILSYHMANMGVKGDPTRIAAGVVTGIGFLGAGTILKHGLDVRGLTTAALIFTTSAIGLSCGAKLYEPAIITLLIAVITLTLIEKIEHKIFSVEKRKIITIQFDSLEIDELSIEELIKQYNIKISDTNINVLVKEKQTILKYAVLYPHSIDQGKMVNDISKLENISSITFTDK